MIRSSEQPFFGASAQENPRDILHEEAFGSRKNIQDAYDEYARDLLRTRIDISDPRFRKVFGDASVERDLKVVAERRKEFKKDLGEAELAKATEWALAFDCADVGWFGELGEDVFVTPASEFDDYVNMTDLVVEFPSKSEKTPADFLAIIDVTTSDDTERLGTKWDRVRSAIEHQNLGRFSYYTSPRDGKVVWVSKEDPKRDDVMWVKGVPHIIIYVPEGTARELVTLPLLQEKYSSDRSRKQAFMDMLEFHKFRKEMQAEIYQFLFRSRQYAEYLLKSRKDKKQIRNIEVLNSVLDRLRGLGYSQKIEDSHIRDVIDRSFPFPGMPK